MCHFLLSLKVSSSFLKVTISNEITVASSDSPALRIFCKARSICCCCVWPYPHGAALISSFHAPGGDLSSYVTDTLFLLYPWVTGFALAMVYSYVGGSLKGTATDKGVRFGLLMWLTASLPSAVEC